MGRLVKAGQSSAGSTSVGTLDVRGRVYVSVDDLLAVHHSDLLVWQELQTKETEHDRKLIDRALKAGHINELKAQVENLQELQVLPHPMTVSVVAKPRRWWHRKDRA